MSTLRGAPGSVWALPRAVDALAESAGQASRPGAIWLAGLGYQFLNLGWTFGATVALPMVQAALPGILEVEWAGVRSKPLFGYDLVSVVTRSGIGVLILGAPLLLIVFRLVAGLARLAPRERWEAARGRRGHARARFAWREGRGLSISALGLWIYMVLMMFFVSLLFIGPAQLLVRVAHWDAWNPLTGVMVGAAAALMLIYSFLLSILFQIALHSLVRNRRGVASALLHAWRIAKNDPSATVRATVVDAVLYLTILALLLSVTVVVGLVIPDETLAAALILMLAMLLDGFAGCTRCIYWGRAYEALGGLSTVDDAPG